jgi:Flp pilus assembly protein TadD
MTPLGQTLSSIVLLAILSLGAAAKDIRIPIPTRSKPTPAQKYNQEGVKQLKKGHIKDAKKAFYKAYLVDPNDPFTLNNLGYVAELEGEIDRATRYYDLASANASDAVIDKSVSKKVIGKPVSEVAGHTEGGPLQVNRLNVQAIGLLERDRVFEAENVLNRALALDPTNPFTLNNLGYTKEKEGELEQAVQLYEKAATQHSDERIIVAVDRNKSWRGKKISSIAERNARKVRDLVEKDQSLEAKVARLNLRGVTALNRNDRNAARNLFFEAYKLDSQNAFALNNMGYLAELENDKESASAYYRAAQRADRSKVRVGLATRRDAEGRPVATVADTNDVVVAQKLEQETAERRTKLGDRPVQVKTRDGQTVEPPARQPNPEDEEDFGNPPPEQQQPKATPEQRANPNDQQTPQLQTRPAGDQQSQPVTETPAEPSQQQNAPTPPQQQTPNPNEPPK